MTDPIDLSTVPTAALYSEIGRRRVAMRKKAVSVGSKPRLRPCPLGCGFVAGVKAQLAHRPECPKKNCEIIPD